MKSSPLPGGPESVWQELETTCDEAIQASPQVGALIDRGVGSAEFVAPLRRELELARSIQSGIARSGDSRPDSSPPPDVNATARDRFARHLDQLLDLERDNRRQLSRRGVVISGLPTRANSGRKPLSR